MGIACIPPSYSIEFPNIILCTFINNNTNKDIEMSLCHKCMKDARAASVCRGVNVQLLCRCMELVRWIGMTVIS